MDVGLKDLARFGRESMMAGMRLVLALAVAALAAAGCTPLVVGGAVAVVADEAIEQDRGGDGLF